jgi:integrase
LRAVGDPPVSTIGQDTVTKLLDNGFLMAARYRQAVKRAERLGLPLPERPMPRPGTITREIINPLRAACAMVGVTPDFVIPAENEGRTVYFMPDEAERVISEASAHLKPLLIFLGCTGTRLGEALKIRWNDRPAPIDLVGRRALLFSDQTKGKKQRVVELTPRVVEALTDLRTAQQAKRTEMDGAATKRGACPPPDPGTVFRTPDGEPYAGEGGSPIKTAHAAAVRRAGLDPKVFTPHIWRHTWATYHYALHKDPLKLMVDGGWSDLKLVTRYAHLMPARHERAILRFLGVRDGPVTDIGPHTVTV